MIPINRNSFTIRPRKPFFDWVNTLFEGEEPITNKEENNVYLVREFDSNEEVQRWIEKNFKAIFDNELNDWYTDESKWPKNRTLAMFKLWFEVEINSMVLDLEDFDVEKE